MTKAAFKPVQNRNISDEIATQVRTEILKGTYGAGEKLPSERELALAFGVNRMTVREALLKLQALGLVSIRQGSGVEVLDYRDTGNLDLLIHLVTIPDAEGKYDRRALASISEVGGDLMLLAVELAFRRMPPEEFVELEGLLERQLELIDDVDAFLHNNLEIHRQLFVGARSIALRLLFTNVRDIYGAYSSPFRAIFEDDTRRDREKVLGWYREALDATRRRDADAVKDVIRSVFRPENQERFVDFLARNTF